MWKRNVIKKNTRTSMKQNYWRMISVCFLITMLTAAYPVSFTFLGANTTAFSAARQESTPFTAETTNSELITETVSALFPDPSIRDFLDSPAAACANLLVDLYSAGISAFFSVLRAVNSFLTEQWDIATLFLIVGVIFSFLYHVFVNNILLVGEKRFFLETKNYRQTRISKIFFLYKLRFLRRPAWIMLCRTVFQLLWNLTIVGGIIKSLEYSMIPYILAENPGIERKNAFILSRQLMRGSKWKLFLLRLSFLGWRVLSLFTFGLLDFIIVNPYKTGCEAELYLTLRRNYVLSRSPRYECLNDHYLDRVLSDDELLISKALYDDSLGPYTQISYFAPEQYPAFLFSVQPPLSALKQSVDPGRKYGFLTCVFLFHAFSLFGWISGVLIQLLRDGTLPGLSSLMFPWMPLYGICGVLILPVVKRFLEKPVLVFMVNFALFSVLEYLSNWLLEAGSGVKPADYSGYFLNLNGRTYIGGGISFALLGCAFLYYFAPKWAGFFQRLSHAKHIAVCVILSALFLTGAAFFAFPLFV